MKLKEYWGSWRMERKLLALDAHSLRLPGSDDLPVVVSLTSMPSRLHRVHLTVRSVLAQRRKPSRLVLWLNSELERKVPGSLQELKGEVFEIRFRGMRCPHRKLIFALQEFTQAVIVTCDDDMMYSEDWLNRLYSDHEVHPQDIIAHECRRILAAKDGGWLPYRQWPMVSQGGLCGRELLPIGSSGVLYPPGSLHDQTTDESLFMSFAPRADDLWFKAMSILKGTQVRRSLHPYPRPVPVIGTKQTSLLKTNVREDGNRLQWELLSERFQIRF